MTSPITSLGSTTAASGTTTTPSSTMNRNAFLQLLVAQLSHQDPLAPAQGTEFVAQLAQFAIVEQSEGQTTRLDLLSTQLRGLSNNAASSLVGHTVTVRGHGIAFDGTLATGASVSLAGPAQTVTASIRDAGGHVVRTIQLGARAAGTAPVSWDGRNDNGQTVPAGAYTLDVHATAADGTDVPVSQDVTGVVTRVSYDAGYPQLVLDSGATAPVSDLVSVGGTPTAPSTGTHTGTP